MTTLVFDGFAEWLVGLLGRMAQQAVTSMLETLLDATTRVSFIDGWWIEPQAQELVQAVLALAGGLMVVFLLLALLQSLLAGDPGMALRAAAVDAPVSVFGTIVLGVAVTAVVQATDAAAGVVLDGGEEVAQALATLATPMAGTPLSGLLVGLFALGAFLIWVELVVREALLYLLVAFAPLMLAGRVWPAARGVWKRTVEVGFAIIVSKFVIAFALRLGATAVNTGTRDGVDLAGQLGGTVLLLVAAFMPYTLFRLLDVAADAARAQGVATAPWRAGMAALQTGFYLRGLNSLAGSGGAAGSGGGGGAVVGAPGGPPALGPGSTARPLPPGDPTRGAVGPGARALGPGPRALGPGPRALPPGDGSSAAGGSPPPPEGGSPPPASPPPAPPPGRGPAGAGSSGARPAPSTGGNGGPLAVSPPAPPSAPAAPARPTRLRTPPGDSAGITGGAASAAPAAAAASAAPAAAAGPPAAAIPPRPAASAGQASPTGHLGKVQGPRGPVRPVGAPRSRPAAPPTTGASRPTTTASPPPPSPPAAPPAPRPRPVGPVQPLRPHIPPAPHRRSLS